VNYIQREVKDRSNENITYMKFTLSVFYTNPKYHFDFSYKIFLSIRSELRNRILRHVNKHNIAEKGLLLDIQFDTNRKIKRTTLKKIVLDKRNKAISYVVYLPYDDIVNSKTPQKAFINEIFKGIEQVLLKLNINIEKLDLIRKDIIKQYK